MKRRRLFVGVGLVGAAAVALAACTASSSSSQADASTAGGTAVSSQGPNAYAPTPQNPPRPDYVGTGTADISIPDGMCAVLVWNGSKKNGRGFAFAGMPGTDLDYGEGLDLWFIPGCGNMARDIIVGTNLLTNAINEHVGDRAQPAPGDWPAFTSDGKPVYVVLRADWNLNQAEHALSEFWGGVCQKFGCAIQVPDPSHLPTLGATSSSPGWNRMLGELALPTLDQMVTEFMPNYSSAIISGQHGFVALQKQLSNDLSNAFNSYFSVKTGQPLPLFCATGISHWVNLATDDYHCAPPRITVQQVIPADELNFGKYGNNARNVAAIEAVMAACHADKLPNCPAILSKNQLALAG